MIWEYQAAQMENHECHADAAEAIDHMRTDDWIESHSCRAGQEKYEEEIGEPLGVFLSSVPHDAIAVSDIPSITVADECIVNHEIAAKEVRKGKQHGDDQCYRHNEPIFSSILTHPSGFLLPWSHLC
jgi:hypothetical protein